MQRDGGSDEVADLRAMAAELERQFAVYKQRLAERNARTAHDNDDAAAACVDDDASGGGGANEEAEEEVEPGYDDIGGGDVRGRMYEAYVRRRDERLRQGWRARMERKEAEVKAFWAQLELTGRASGGVERAPPAGADTVTDDAGAEAGDEEEKTERDVDDKRRSSDAATAPAPKRITGKKHARTRSFSSSTNTVRNSPDVGRRRALSQEPAEPSEPQAAGDASKENRARPVRGAATATKATSRPKTALRRKNSVKGHGGAKPAGPKLLPRSLPRRASSSGLEDLGKEAVPPSADAFVLRCSDEQDAHGETSKASPPRPSVGGGARATTNAETASPDSGRSEVVDVVQDGEPEVEKRGDEQVDAPSPEKLGNPNGEITSDSDIESSYVYINKDVVEDHAIPEPHAATQFSLKTSEDNAERTTAPAPAAGATAKEIATTNAEEAPATNSSRESSFSGSGRLGRSPPGSAAPSCSSRDQSIERVLEADAALLRKKREKRAEKSALRTPGSAGSRVSGTTWSPKETPTGFKRFLSFGKKNRAREVIDCASPSVSLVVDDHDIRGGWQSAGSIKPRMGSSDAASDDVDHGRTTSRRACSLQSLVSASPAKSELDEIVPQVKSPKAHRSFFSFRALNCGRG